MIKYAAAIESELPSRSLQDALDRDSEVIQAFVDTLKESFIVKE